MNSDNYEMYKIVDGLYQQLLNDGREATVAGFEARNAVEYWWKRLTNDERQEVLSSAKQELEKAFSKKFSENFPNTQL